MNIQRICRDSSERICASQVISNIHSCVRELVENSLDANSDSISVRIRNSGDQIEVADNGSGIDEADWPLVCLPHATSKLRQHSELLSEDVHSYGFRGEALAALCILSKEVRIVTRTKESECGTVLLFGEDGALTNFDEKVSKSVGTTVTIQGIYRDTLPVRFLEMTRSIKKEVKIVQHLLTELAIMNHRKSFELLWDGKCILSSLAASSPYEVYKRLVSGGNLEEIACSDSEFNLQVSGWITPTVPTCSSGEFSSKSSEQFQVMYMNGRPMTVNKKLVKSLTAIYEKFHVVKVSFILMLELENGNRFDRNASVDKRVILFAAEIEDRLIHTITDELRRMFDRKPTREKEASVELRSSAVTPATPGSKKGSSETPRFPARLLVNTIQAESLKVVKTHDKTIVKRPRDAVEEAPPHPIYEPTITCDVAENHTGRMADEEKVLPPNLPFVFSKEFFHQMELVGQFNNGFIITRLATTSRTDFFLIDQHAANEKYLFEQYHRNIKINHQTLISPISLKLNPSQEDIVEENIEELSINGFRLLVDNDQPPGNRIKIVSLPALSGVGFNRSAALTEADLVELIESLGEENSSGICRGTQSLLTRLRSVRAIFASKACRSAVMVGDSLCATKMTEIVRGLTDLDQPWNCPHGRPTLKHILSLDDLRKPV